jgi:hypothetical protein
MTQITSMKLGLIGIYIATIPWSLAQTPRIGTSGSNQTRVTTPAAAGHSALPGNSTGAGQRRFPSGQKTGDRTYRPIVSRGPAGHNPAPFGGEVSGGNSRVDWLEPVRHQGPGISGSRQDEENA